MISRRCCVVFVVTLLLGATLQAHAEETPASRWSTMAHGWAFLTSNRQGGDSGDQDFESQNHLMIMSSRPTGKWTLTLLGTFTAEPLTIRREGSPELFQRGETYNDVLLVDRQHAHDLFVQLAAQWSRDFGKRNHLRFYLAPWGEPAVGPTAFVHRKSSSANPLAPLAHHNQDSTHISADVVTTSIDLGPVTVEGSMFNGGEPDENRYDIEQGSLDSYSGRLWLRPIPALRFQVSAARRKNPEALEEGNQTRQTASVEYDRPIENGSFAAALITGRNLLEDGQVEWGHTLEWTVTFRTKHTVYGRAERVDRDLYELLNKTQRPDTVLPRRTAVEALTLGYLHDLPVMKPAGAALGAGATLYRFDERLDPVYGERPMSAQVFLRLQFASQGAEHHHHAAAVGVDPQRGEAGGSPGNLPGR